MKTYGDLILYDWADDRCRAVYQALLRYCELATLTMVFVVERCVIWLR
jgi:hypothetical protein